MPGIHFAAGRIVDFHNKWQASVSITCAYSINTHYVILVYMPGIYFAAGLMGNLCLPATLSYQSHPLPIELSRHPKCMQHDPRYIGKYYLGFHYKTPYLVLE